MICPVCHEQIPVVSEICPACHTVLIPGDRPTMVSADRPTQLNMHAQMFHAPAAPVDEAEHIWPVSPYDIARPGQVAQGFPWALLAAGGMIFTSIAIVVAILLIMGSALGASNNSSSNTTRQPAGGVVATPRPSPSPGITPSPSPFASANHVAVSCGGGAVGSFLADPGGSGGATFSTTQTIDTSQVSAPAPQQVYQNERYGDFSYSFQNLTARSSYRIRLHFAEIYVNGSGQRLFNVEINGKRVLKNFDIFNAAGGEDIAIIKEFVAKTDENGHITIHFANGPQNNAKCSGIEIIASH